MLASVHRRYFGLFFTLTMLVGFLFFSVQGIVDAHQNVMPASLETVAIEKPEPIVTPGNISMASVVEEVLVEHPAKPVVTEVAVKSELSVKIGGTGNQMLFEKNAEDRLPIASLTKLMTVLVVLKNYDLGCS